MNVRYLCAMQENASDTIQVMMTDSVGALVSDSVPAKAETPVLSLFTEHQLQVQNNFNHLERPDLGNGFAFMILFICAAIIIYLQRNSDNVFGDVLKASFDHNQALQDARVENSQRTRNLFILQVLGYISIALFIAGGSSVMIHSNLQVESLFFITVGGLLAFILLKKMILWLMAQVFDLRTELRVHNFNLNILQSVAGLLLLPFSLVMFYSPQVPEKVVFYLGLGVGVFFYLKGLQRGILLAFNTPSVSSLNLFYYFCALEILPVFVLIRIVQNMQ